MQRRRQRAQAAGPARNHEQSSAIAQQRGEVAQDMRGAEIIGLDIGVDHGAGIVVGLHPGVMIGKHNIDAAMAFGQ